MPKLSRHFAFMAFALWLLGGWLGAHGHFCFDGQEPPVSVHMHLDGHEAHSHHPEEVHQDTDIELDQSALAKQGKIDLGMLLLTALVLAVLILPAAVIVYSYRIFYPPPDLYLRPLLRAPPITA